MPLDLSPTEACAAALDRALAGLDPLDALERALDFPCLGRVALVSSFGAESVALLHMASRIDPHLPVLFLQTEMLFPETIAYQEAVARSLGLRDVRPVAPDPLAAARRDPEGRLHERDTDACCALRKTEPLARALEPFDGWITGRKRYQGGARAALPTVEASDGRLKLNPLASWSREDVRAYMDTHDLPRHPLVARGYPSIGCSPCTTPVAPGEDVRAGRWRGEGKDECGIHFAAGRAVRTGGAPMDRPLPGRDAA